MLISFSVRNFRTFREQVEWSLVASPDKTREENNVVDLPAFGLRLLKGAVVYGANASGKSKLINALEYMHAFVLTSSDKGQIGKPTYIESFKLNPDSAVDSSEFEIQFIYKNELYRYGFEVSATRIEAEWLFLRTEKGARNKPEVELFYRNGQEIVYNARRFGGIVSELVKNAAVRENALLISVAAQFNQPKATAVLKWFDDLVILSGKDEDWERALTFMLLRHPENHEVIQHFLENADLDIAHIEIGIEKKPFNYKDPDETGEKFRNWSKQQHATTKTLHRAYNNERKPVELVPFSLLLDESTGTKKMLELAGPVLSVLDDGQVLIVDELDARLHPNLVSKIVQLFNSKTTNPNNAQILFNTHDTNLLASGNFRRDQIWFTEKNRYGEATLYSLADFKTDVVKKDDDFEANYVRGKYGAVPYLGNFNALPKSDVTSEAEPAK